MRNLFHQPSLVEIETRKRVQLTLWAYAYEFEADSMVSDEKFDEVAKSIDLSISTTRPDLDKWWRNNFQCWTGMWVHQHPEKDKIKMLYRRLKNHE